MEYKIKLHSSFFFLVKYHVFFVNDEKTDIKQIICLSLRLYAKPNTQQLFIFQKQTSLTLAIQSWALCTQIISKTQIQKLHPKGNKKWTAPVAGEHYFYFFSCRRGSCFLCSNTWQQIIELWIGVWQLLSSKDVAKEWRNASVRRSHPFL